MRIRADRKLFLSYLLLVGFLTLSVSVASESVLRQYLLGTIEDDLAREVALGRQMLLARGTQPPDAVADLLAQLSGRRVTIVDRDGRVLGESDPAPADDPPADDYRNRAEVREALETGQGRAIRFSDTTGEELLYLAQSTDQGEVIRFAVPLTELEVALSNLQRRIMLIGVIAVLPAILFSYFFSQLVTGPLARTVEVARALGAGDLSRRVPATSDDDVGDLGVALNALAEELQRRLSQLEQERAEMQALIDSMSEGVLALNESGTLRRANPAARRMFALGPRIEGLAPEMVSRRPEFMGMVARAIGGETVPAAELTGDGRSLIGTAHPLPQGGAVLVFLDISELRRLEGVRRDFVANASHELKTPLTAIRGYSETLLDPDIPPEVARQFAGVVKKNADRLQRLVDDLLDLSRIEAGAWRVEPEEVNIAEIVREAWSGQLPPDGGGGVELVVQLAAGRETVLADPGALRQVFANLFNNALRYTPSGGRVTVATREGTAQRGLRSVVPGGAPGRWTQIEVSDTGSGIAGVHLSRIFERFYRADPARSREEGGTGLGLAIVKHLVEAHGGWIEAESEVGKGTTIRFVVPASAGGVA